jgi:hypothetical protein
LTTLEVINVFKQRPPRRLFSRKLIEQERNTASSQRRGLQTATPGKYLNTKEIPHPHTDEVFKQQPLENN